MLIWVSIIAAAFLPYLMTRACDPNNVNRDFLMMGPVRPAAWGFTVSCGGSLSCDNTLKFGPY